MRLILIRHPVTFTNIQRIVGNNFEGEITSRGYEQISQLVKRLKNEQVDKLFSSDSKRCKELAEAVGRSKQLSPLYESLFREINNGVWSYKSKKEIEELKQSDPIHTRPDNGESLADLSKRVDLALDLICTKGGECNILFSHGYFLKVFLGNRLGLPLEKAINQLKFSNCAMSEINIGINSCTIEYLNNRDYLHG